MMFIKQQGFTRVACIAFTISTIAAVPAFGQSCVAPPSGLTGWWRAEGNTTDTTGGFNATLINGATYATGKVGQAFHFDGTDDSVSIDDAPALNVGTGNFTVDFWVKPATDGGELGLVEKWDDPAGSGWTLTDRGGLYFAGNGGDIQTSAQIPAGSWSHVALRRNGNTVALFLNGGQVGSASNSNTFSSNVPLLFGRRRGSQGFFLSGEIDEVHYFVGTALSNAQITAIYNAGSAGFCAPSLCGNNMPDAGEECDDGNTISGDGCDSNCKITGCGNGVQTSGEACDDGNMVNTDACKDDCTLNVCGDAVPETGVEQCDDGNLIDDDGCDSNCTTTACGNGILTSGEVCDDGNLADTDACLHDCTLNICGDGHTNTGVEACDDGNMVDTDACKSDCSANVCGDGLLNTGVEVCDDGNVLDGDGCDSDCTVSGPCATLPPGLTAWWTADGSGADIQSGYNAELKNGATFAVGRSRLAFNLDGANDYIKVPDNAALDVGTGDFTVDLWVNFNDTAGEQVLVEKYVETFNDAASGWTLTKLDGDSVLLAAGGSNAGSRRLTLTPNTWIHFAARRSGNALAVFMNGTQVANDEVAADLSSPSSLKFGHRGGPTDTPGSLDTRGFFLNGRIDEVHYVVGRALSDMEIQAIVSAGRSGLCVPTPTCGNTFIEAGEACDDGNAVAGDGCENDCTLSCGNGVSDSGEACDDGNATNGDGCDTNCTISACGNGIAAGSEECEDGNSTNGDGCDNNCTDTACGNGIRTSGEDCDDGNSVDGDGCESDCTLTTVNETLPPGGSASTGSSASPEIPIQTTLTTPDGGMVSIATSSEPLTPATVLALVRDLLIQAPPASVAAPLVVTLTVDASAIPAGVDLLRVALIVDGVVLGDCSGTPPGAADPDPCIQSRVLLPDAPFHTPVSRPIPRGPGAGPPPPLGQARTTITPVASVWGVGVSGIDADAQKCVNGVAKAGIGVVKAQNKADANCLKGAIQGEVSNAQTCLTADAGGKVQASTQKTSSFVADRCVPLPPLGLTSANTVNTATQQAALGLMTDLFGGDLTSAVANDKAGASCQLATVKAVQKLFLLNTQLFLACEKSGLAGDTSLIVATPDLARCFSDLTLNPKVLKAVSKLGGTIAGKCSGDLTTLLPGVCGGARNVAYCLQTRVECRICQMFNATNGLSEDCDSFDDFEVNGSCS